MRHTLVLAISFLIFSCSQSEIQDPIAGLQDVFIYDGRIYNTAGVDYGLYNKVSGQYYYYFIMGTSGQFLPNDTISKARVAGDFVRVLLVADSLDKIFGQYQILASDLNVVSVGGKIETIEAGQLIISQDVNKRQQLEIRATTKTNKRLDARGEFSTGDIAYRVYRTVKGSFSLKDSTYDLSRAWNKFDSSSSHMALAFEDNNDSIASQLFFDVSDSDRVINSSYYTVAGYVRLNYVKTKKLKYYDYVQSAKLEFAKSGEKYNAIIHVRTVKGDSLKGTYSGIVERF